jgi:hypothetical protein
MECSFEIAHLPEDTPMLIGLDILADLGIGIVGIPVDYPDAKIKPAVIEAEEPHDIISSELNGDELDLEFKKERDSFLHEIQPVLTEHVQSPLTQPGTFCTVPESVVKLPIPDDQQLYVQQYPIPHTLQPLMDEAVVK